LLGFHNSDFVVERSDCCIPAQRTGGRIFQSPKRGIRNSPDGDSGIRP
jgi:hypothetical protein